MLRLIIILLVVYLFVRFFKRMTLAGPGQRDSFQRNSPQNPNQSSGPPFDDIEEAEFTEVKEEKKKDSEKDSTS
ncbi:MAG TPA: hypothetical protein VJ991_08220 [Balneolales bacterium]|nr:hypothetical protein [Balneolales bacterium]